jgi:hypothetical protein
MLDDRIVRSSYTLGPDGDVTRRNRKTAHQPAPAQAEREPTASAQDTAMNDASALPPTNGATSDNSQHLDDGAPSLAPSGGRETLNPSQPSPLEERLRRLEDALSQVPDPKQIENRIAERVAERLTTSQRSIPVAQIAPAQQVAAAAPGVHIPAGVMLDVGKRILNSTASMAKAAAGTEQQESSLATGVRRTVMFFDMVTETRAIWCMFTDPRYKMTWAGWLVPLGLMLFLLASSYIIPGAQIPVVGPLIDKAVDIVPAFILFKWLSHEARRYRETAPDLPPNLRL